MGPGSLRSARAVRTFVPRRLVGRIPRHLAALSRRGLPRNAGWCSVALGLSGWEVLGALTLGRATGAGCRKARATGLEPATSGVTGRRSNQLNYARWRSRG